MDNLDKLSSMVYASLGNEIEISEDNIDIIVDEIILKNIEFNLLSLKEKIKLKKAMINSIKGLDILTELLDDDNVNEIMINAYDKIFIEKNNKLIRYDGAFASKERLFDVIQKIMSKTNRVVNESSPIVDTRLDDGSRVNIVLEPISLDGATVTIRKFPKEVMSIKKLIEYGSIDKNIAEFLEKLIVARYNIFISGSTSSGKTSMLNAMCGLIPKDERIITIEDSAEIKIDGVDNLVRLEVRNANVAGENAVTMRSLIKSALRMRPSRIIVGEVRGEEAIEMLQAMNTGHNGSISTGHANSARDMIYRLETMALMGIDIPLIALRNQISSAIEIIVHLGRLKDGSRKLLEIQEVCGIENGEVVLNLLYHYDDNGKFIKDNDMIFNEKLELV